MARNFPGELGSERSDAVLVSDALAGSREAFRVIVERYQTLLCSVAYNATGSLNRSEDLAQEAFVAAWSRLGSLREPEKLRAWLCGIVRHLVLRHRRDEGREPVSVAEPIESAHATLASEAPPSDQAITRDEEALLWRALEQIPSNYREPLILFYREHQSIEQVAAALELSEDAAKQRLSRGRKLLQEEVQTMVENTLRRSAPGRAFSGVVITMLPAAVGPAASIGIAGKGAAKFGLLGAWLLPLAPFFGIGAGVVGQSLLARDLATNPRQRRKWIIGIAIAWIGYVALAAGGEAMVHGLTTDKNSGTRFIAVVTYWWLFVAGTLALQFVVLRRLRHLWAEPSRSWRIRPDTATALTVGLHLALFGPLLTQAWRWADTTGMMIIVAVVAVLGVISVRRLRKRGEEGAAILRQIGEHTAVAGGVLLLILALRAEVWLATAHNLTVSETHRAVVPIWLVPGLSLALVLWVGVLAAAMRRGKRGDRR